MECIVLSSASENEDDDDVQFIKEVTKAPIIKTDETDVMFYSLSTPDVNKLATDLCLKHSKKDKPTDIVIPKQLTIKKVISYKEPPAKHDSEDDDVQIIYETYSKKSNISVDTIKNISSDLKTKLKSSSVLYEPSIVNPVEPRPNELTKCKPLTKCKTNNSEIQNQPVVDNRLSCTVRKLSTNERDHCDNEVEIISENFLVNGPNAKEKDTTLKHMGPSSQDISRKMVPNSLGIIISNTSESQNVTIIDNQSNSSKKKVQLTFLGSSRQNTSSNDSTPQVKTKDGRDQQSDKTRKNIEKIIKDMKEANQMPIQKSGSGQHKSIAEKNSTTTVSKPKKSSEVPKPLKSKSPVQINEPPKIEVPELKQKIQVKLQESSTSVGAVVNKDNSSRSSISVQGHDTNEDVSSNDESPNPCNSRQLKLIRDKFDMFLDVCKQIVNNPTMEKANNKLDKYYCSASDDHLLKTEFKQKLEGITNKLKANKDINPFEYMKKILIYLKAGSQFKENPKIVKLEKVLKEVNKKIKQLEDAEVTSSDDENDNSYIQLDRYRKRAVQIFNKICELRGESCNAERHFLGKFYFEVRIPDTFSNSNTVKKIFESASHALEKYYNKYRKFPDFHDVKSLVKKHCDQNNFTITPDKLHCISEHLFVQFGRKLQNRRKYDDGLICNEYMPIDAEDPAQHDEELSLKLKLNKKTRRSEQEVLDAFVSKQMHLQDKDGSDDNPSSDSSRSDSNDEDKEHKHKKSTEEKNTPSTSKEGTKTIKMSDYSIEQDSQKSEVPNFFETLGLERDTSKRKHNGESSNEEGLVETKRKKKHSDNQLEEDNLPPYSKFSLNDILLSDKVNVGDSFAKSIIKRHNSSPELSICEDSGLIERPLRKYHSADNITKMCETEKKPSDLYSSNEKDDNLVTYEVCDSENGDTGPLRKLSQEEIDELIPFVMYVDD